MHQGLRRPHAGVRELDASGCAASPGRPGLGATGAARHSAVHLASGHRPAQTGRGTARLWGDECQVKAATVA